ncbi:MAG: T9SS type A sorting domain-containing protein [Prevotella sp.]|nr:T9SS type A sorting domain-containing protein [Prevotella sp.]
MKHITLALLLAILGNLSAFSQDEEDSIGYVVYVDSIQYASSSRQTKRPVRVKRSPAEIIVLSRKGKMKAKCTTDDEEMRDGMLRCLRVAMDVWEECIENSQQVSFNVSLTYDMDPALEIKTEVAYSRLGRWNSRVYSLNSQEHSLVDVNNSISINADVNWDYSWTEDVDGGYDNLITALLRHIGHILGFGSSITTVNGQLGFAINRCSSDFDNLIYNSQGVCLGNIARTATSSALSAFLKGNLALKLPSAEYALYSNHTASEPSRDAKYFSLVDDNIMNYPYGDRSLLMDVNRETLDALEAIGWTVRPHSMKIVGSNVDEVGYGSAYKSHTFQMTDADNTAQSTTWKYQIYRNSTGQYTDISSGYGSSFTINSANIISDAIDDYDCLQGRIVSSVTQNGTTSEYTKPLFLELKPELISYEILNVNTSTETNFFSFDLKLNHLGTTQGYLSVVNEYGLSSSYTFTGDGVTTIHIGNAFKYGQTYLYLTLHNEYGDNGKTIYLNTNALQTNSVSAHKTAQFIPNIQAKRNGESVSGMLCIHDRDSLDFALTDFQTDDGQGCEFVWELMLEKKNGDVWCKNLGSSIDKCSFMVRPSLLPISEEFSGVRFMLKRQLDMDTNTLYYSGLIKVSVRRKNATWECAYYPLMVDVLPTKPTIRMLDYREVYDEYTNDTYPVAELEIDTRNFLGGYFFTTSGTWLEATGLAFDEGTSMPLRGEIDWGSLTCGFGCMVSNAYGVVNSDTIYPALQTLDINRVSLINVTIQSDGQEIVVVGIQPLDEISITNSSGRICATRRNTSFMQEYLPKGLYLVTLRKENEKITKKIIIK